MPGVTAWGTEFLVNTNTQYDQKLPAVAGLPDGRFIVTWGGVDVGTSGIRAQLFNADGTPSGDEFGVNNVITGSQSEPEITVLSGGRFVVTWNDFSLSLGDTDNYAVHARVFNIDGTPVGDEFLVNTTTTASAQFYPDIAALDDGGFVVVFQSYNGTDYDILGQRFDQDGTPVGSELPVDVSAGGQYNPSAATLHAEDGRFVVAWSTNGDGSGEGVRVQLYNADGTTLGDPFFANTHTASTQSTPYITALTGGNFVIVWTDGSQSSDDSSGLAVRGQLFDVDGNPVGDEFLINTSTTDAQRDVVVAALDDGRFITAWTDNNGADGSCVRGQLFNADGSKSGAEFLVNTTETGDQKDADISVLADGRIVITWSDTSASGGDTDGYAVRAQIFDPREAGVDLAGTDFDDDLVGTAFNDVFHGTVGADRFAGDAGNDTYYVDDNDTIIEGVNGGSDTVVTNLTYLLGDNLENLTLGGGEAIDGTGNGLANKLVGNDAANVLTGLGDNDILDGRGGADQMIGGTGNDRYIVDNAGDKVVELGGEGIDTVEASITYKLGNAVEHLVLTGTVAINGTGNGLANQITGNGRANILKGNGGNDVLKGGGGNDTLRGDAGSDRLGGGDGRDTMTGGAGKDFFLFDSALKAANVDKVLDFSHKDDTILLDDAIFAAIGPKLSAAEFFKGAHAHDANDRIIYNDKTGALIYDANGNKAGGASTIAILGKHLAVDHTDFLIV